MDYIQSKKRRTDTMPPNQSSLDTVKSLLDAGFTIPPRFRKEVANFCADVDRVDNFFTYRQFTESNNMEVTVLLSSNIGYNA